MKADPNNDKDNSGNRAQSSWKAQLIEVSVFLFLIVPSMALSFFAVKQGSLGFVIVAFSVILRDLALVSLIFFFIWRNGESIRRLGWTLENGWKEAVLGVVLFVPFFYSAALLESMLLAAGFSAPSPPLPSFLAAKGVTEIALAFVLVVVVAVTEETIFRGYLI